MSIKASRKKIITWQILNKSLVIKNELHYVNTYKAKVLNFICNLGHMVVYQNGI